MTENQNFEGGDTYFVIIQVRDDTVEKLVAYLPTALEAVAMFHGITEVTSSIVLSVFGFPKQAWVAHRDKLTTNYCLEAANAVKLQLGCNMKAIYGRTYGACGSAGAPNFLHYGSLIPNFSGMIGELLRLEFGNIQEYRIVE